MDQFNISIALVILIDPLKLLTFRGFSQTSQSSKIKFLADQHENLKGKVVDARFETEQLVCHGRSSIVPWGLQARMR